MDANKIELPKCVLCGFNDGHNEWCDRNPAKGQPIEYQLARVACAITVPKGFAQCVDGTDGMRVGTNVASVEEWRQFFVTFLAQGVLQTEQPKDEAAAALDAIYRTPCDHLRTKPCHACEQQRESEWMDKYAEALCRTTQAQGRVCDVCGKEQAKDPYAYCQGHGEPA